MHRRSLYNSMNAEEIYLIGVSAFAIVFNTRAHTHIGYNLILPAEGRNDATKYYPKRLKYQLVAFRSFSLHLPYIYTLDGLAD